MERKKQNTSPLLKIIILSAVFILPLTAFYFFKFFSEQKLKKLQIYTPESTDCPANLEGDTAHHILPFRLTDQDGKTFTRENLRGKIVVSDFIFTRCPNICIDMSSEMLRLQEAFKGSNDLIFLSHTIDPEHDSVQVLKKYAQELNADENLWRFVTGSKDSLYRLAKCSYFIVAAQKGDNPEDFDHSDKFILTDKEGRIRGYYRGTDKVETDRLMTEIRLLRLEYEK
jgi:protein SCO1/2